jgi:ubiquinone/menaquinone biosynthesis C-methylase UbiE
VLDVGCGTGNLCQMLRQSHVEAFGLDPSPSMLWVSRNRDENRGPSILGRGERLPFSPQRFDGVAFTLVLHENTASNQYVLLEEALRVLAPGGTLFLLDYVRPSSPSGRFVSALAFIVEGIAGGEHFRNYRAFMRNGALGGLLTTVPRESIRWENVFLGSMALVFIHNS